MSDIKYNETKVIVLVIFFLSLYWLDIIYPDLPFVPSVRSPFVR